MGFRDRGTKDVSVAIERSQGQNNATALEIKRLVLGGVNMSYLAKVSD
jgi:hypothetical protein